VRPTVCTECGGFKQPPAKPLTTNIESLTESLRQREETLKEQQELLRKSTVELEQKKKELDAQKLILMTRERIAEQEMIKYVGRIYIYSNRKKNKTL